MGLGTSFGVYASTDVAAEDGEDTGIAFGGGRGLFGGGVSTIDTIDYVTISTPSNATDFGDLPVGRYGLSACSNGTRGVFGGGYVSSGYNNRIEYVTIATTGNATWFGFLTVKRRYLGACSDGTKGVWGGGETNTNTIDYVTIASPSNATDFGDLTVGRYGLAACSGD